MPRRVGGQFGWPGAAVLVFAVLSLCAATTARAAQVSVDVSSRGVYADIEFYLQIQIANADSFEMPTLPDMEGIDVLGPPQRSESTRITTVNGRMTQRRDITLRYPLVVRREGEFTIPPIEVIADGERFQSAAIPITATSPAAGEELLVDVIAPESIYLGQPLKMTLRIWIKPYASEEFRIRTTSDQMWSLIQSDSSNWSVFQSAVEAAGDLRRGGGPRVRELSRQTDDGQSQTYFMYELEVTQWPDSAGPIDVPPVQVLLAYPTRLERRRTMFGDSDLTIADWQPMMREVEIPPVEVLSPPTAGQPDVFSGAVGEFAMSVRAQPKNVAVGDPITLTIDITDRTGNAQLELLQPPPLQRVDALTDDFRLPTEPLTGVVRGSTKTFRQTIRATRSDITQIPPIPFAYFDPNPKRYIVLRSDPIPINVEQSQAVGLADVEGAGEPDRPASTELTAFEGGILANASGDDELLSDQRFRMHWFHWFVIAVAPVAFALVATVRIRSQRLSRDVSARRARQAGRAARSRLAEAKRVPASEQADLVAAAVCGYVADRDNSSGQAMARADVVSRLHQWSAPAELIRDVETLLLDCDALRYGAVAGGGSNSIVERAQRCIDQLERGQRR